MKITIDKDFYIEKDEYCYTLKESTGKVDKEGKEIAKTYGYFNSMTSVLLKLKTVKTGKALNEDTITIVEYIEELKRQTEEINRIFEGLE